jgi:AcrR family transcriptional regulator
MRKLDPRVIRTRAMLRDALVAMILEKGYHATDIGDITERAGLRRATFYLHYRNKEELLIVTLHETLDALMQKMDELPSSEFNEETEHREQMMTFAHVQEHAALYHAILSGQGTAEIMRNLRDFLVKRIEERCSARHPKLVLTVPIDILANYLTAVRLNMIIWWLDAGMPYSVEQMADMCTRLVFRGANSAMDVASDTLPMLRS